MILINIVVYSFVIQLMAEIIAWNISLRDRWNLCWKYFYWMERSWKMSLAFLPVGDWLRALTFGIHQEFLQLFSPLQRKLLPNRVGKEAAAAAAAPLVPPPPSCTRTHAQMRSRSRSRSAKAAGCRRMHEMPKEKAKKNQSCFFSPPHPQPVLASLLNGEQIAFLPLPSWKKTHSNEQSHLQHLVVKTFL